LDQSLREALAGLDAEKAVDRVWAKDFTLWKDRDEEISNRLGWLDAAVETQVAAADREGFVRELRAEGFTHALVLGMGGSSLAPEVFARVYGPSRGGLSLSVLDSTDPAAVERMRSALPIDHTLFIVSSKSGTTLETSSFLSYFFAETASVVGAVRAGRSFIAVTDPGTPLARLAESLAFRRIFHGDPNVGGRFSALTPFGLIPAALLGVDIGSLLLSARTAARACRIAESACNPGAYLGAVLATAARRGIDKLALFLPHRLESLGAWIEQLVAESTGKEGRGILPLPGRRPEDESGAGGLLAGGADVLPVFFEDADDRSWTGVKDRALPSGRPCLLLRTEGEAGLGGQIFLWEFATAVAGRLLGVNPFDQPDVASSKKRTMESLAEAIRVGRVPMEAPTVRSADVSLWAGFEAADPADALRRLAASVEPGGYAVFQAFLPPQPPVRAALRALALRFQALSGHPSAFDFGPRFLHSTGQLHKGDQGRGIFIQFTADHPRDLAVPGTPGGPASTYSFGTLIDAQAAGDRRALLEKGRRVLSVRFHGDPAAGLKALAEAL
jgi:glucose-6-phosphate isomerase